MDILGVGPLEIVVILVIALLVFGPERLPEIGAKLGQAVRELRNLSREITREVDTVRAAVTGPVEELSRPFQEAGQVMQDLSQAADTVRNPGQALEKALISQLAPAKAPAPEAENTIAGASGAPQDAAMPGAMPTEPENAPADNGSATAVAGSAEPSAPMPSTSEKPTSEKPASEKPASEKPASEKPASEKPVAEADVTPAPAVPLSSPASDQEWEI